jgi:hypothetical protein
MGVGMLVAALGILLSYLYMQKVFIETVTLRESQYKTNLQKGFLTIAVAYGLKSIYSMGFKYYAKLVAT